MTEKEAAASYKCDIRTIQRWKKAGAPIDNPGEMAKWLGSRKEVPAGTADALKDFCGLKDLTSARLAKTIVECERLQHRLDVERGKYVLATQAMADSLRIQSAVRSELQKLLAEAPNWAGMTSVQIHAKAQAFLDSMCANMSDEYGSIYKAK